MKTPPGIVIDGSTESGQATTVQFGVGDDVYIQDWYLSELDNSEWWYAYSKWVPDRDGGIYLSFEAFDRLVEAVREQRAKEAEAVKETK